MRVLLDEHLPVRFARELEGHEVATVRDQDWSGLRNGALLQAAASAGFDVLLSNDAGIEHQQDLRDLELGVVIIGARSNKLEDLVELLPAIEQALGASVRGGVVHVAPGNTALDPTLASLRAGHRQVRWADATR